jgi:hypothetical protein
MGWVIDFSIGLIQFTHHIHIRTVIVHASTRFYTMGTTSGTETPNYSRAPEYTPRFYLDSCYSIFRKDREVLTTSGTYLWSTQPKGNSWYNSFLVVNIVQILHISILYMSDVKNNTII